MNYKIISHLMPWDLDYALLSYTQLKKSKYYLNDEDKIYIDVTLNLSDHIINWKESKISKEFFIAKIKALQPLLQDYICCFKIYEGNELYGHLDTQREAIEDHIDYYSYLNVDMYFSENLIAYLLAGAKQITNKYFTITPQIPKLWDNTWDVISHPNYNRVSYKEWNTLDTYDVRYFNKYQTDEIRLTPTNTHKWAGWMDLYNKNTWNDFWVSHKDWTGYGPCDWYSILLSQYAKTKGVDFQQYILENQIVCEYEIGPLKDKNFSKYYKDMLVLNNIPNQREQFESRMQEYLQKGIQQLKDKNII
jgi:hypothetical protein